MSTTPSEPQATLSNDPGHWLKEQKVWGAKPLRRLRWMAPAQGVLIVIQAWLVAGTINAVVFDSAALTVVWPALWAMLPVFFLRFILGWQVERQSFHAAVEVKREIRSRLFDKLRALGPVPLMNEETGALASSVVDGVENLDAYFARYLPAVTMMSMVPLVILVAVFPSDVLSGLVLLVTAPLVPLFMLLIGKGAESLNQKQWRQLARMGAYFLGVIQTFTTRKIFNASRREIDNIAQISEQFRRSTMSVLRVAFLTSAVLEFFAALSIALIAVFVGFRLLAGEMSFLHGFIVLLLAPEFYLPLRNFGAQNHARMEAVGAAENIIRILNMPSPRPINQAARESRAQNNLRFQGGIEFNGVHFAYEKGRPALSALSLRVEPGEHIAIVGPSGSGKSTLANVLLGFCYPDTGIIRVGDQELRADILGGWRESISWIPQKVRLFHGTVADNIRLGAPKISDAAVLAAADAADARDFIEALPQGFSTLIGDGGQELSGGQAQRIGIARALVRNTPYLLLDEPTAHLDRESEERVSNALQKLVVGRTVISIAHRLQTVRQADRIVVLNDGFVVQSGRYSALATRPGVFAELLRDGQELSA